MYLRNGFGAMATSHCRMLTFCVLILWPWVLEASLELVRNGVPTAVVGMMHWRRASDSPQLCYVGSISNGQFGFRGPTRLVNNGGLFYCKMYQDVSITCNRSATLTVTSTLFKVPPDFALVVVTALGARGSNLSYTTLENVQSGNSVTLTANLTITASIQALRIEFSSYVNATAPNNQHLNADAGASNISVMLPAASACTVSLSESVSNSISSGQTNSVSSRLTSSSNSITPTHNNNRTSSSSTTESGMTSPSGIALQTQTDTVAVPPASPTFVHPTGVQATETVAVVFASIAATAAASSVLSQVVLGVGQCTAYHSRDNSDDPPAMHLVSPFWATRSCKMVALGNPLIAGVTLGLHLLACRFYALVLGCSASACRARLRWPHWSLVFATLMVQGTLLGAVRCLGYDADGGDIVAGLFGLLMGAVLGLNFFVVRWRYAANVWLEPREVVAGWRRIAFLLPAADWVPLQTNAKYGASFSSMRGESVFWWPAVPQFAVPLVYAVVSGVRLPPDVRHSVCDVLLWTAVVAVLAAAVCCLWLRPYRCPMNSYAVAAGLVVLGCSTVLYSGVVRSNVDESTLRNATAVFGALQFIVTMLTMLCMMVGRLVLRTVSFDASNTLLGSEIFKAPTSSDPHIDGVAAEVSSSPEVVSPPDLVEIIDEAAVCLTEVLIESRNKPSLLLEIVDVHLGSCDLLREFYDADFSIQKKY